MVGTSVNGETKDHLRVSIVSAHFSGSKPNTIAVIDGNPKPGMEVFQADIEKEGVQPVIAEKQGSLDEEMVLSGTDVSGALNVETSNPMMPPSSSKRSKRGGKPYFQTFLNLGGKKNGRFANIVPTFYNSVNLDEPTYQRKGVFFN